MHTVHNIQGMDMSMVMPQLHRKFIAHLILHMKKVSRYDVVIRGPRKSHSGLHGGIDCPVT